MTKIINREILSRKKYKDDTGKIVGVEIRHRRLTLCKTLASLADKICSVSYVSKIENNLASVNNYYLHELCNRVELDEQQINALMNLKTIIIRSITAYVNNDVDTITIMYQEGKGLSNYRYRIVEFIYYLFCKDLYNANESYVAITKLITSMGDFDLYVFSLFSSVLYFYNQLYLDSFETAKILVGIDVSDDFKLLCHRCLFLSLYKMNRHDTTPAYYMYKEELIKNAKYDMLDEINYYYALYLLKNSSNFEYDIVIRQIRDFKYLNSIRLYYDFLHNSFDISEYEDVELTKFFKLLLLVYKNPNEAKEIVSTINEFDYEYDLNVQLINYLLLETNKEKLDYITNVILPQAQRSNDEFNIDYFLYELSTIAIKDFKYKIFTLCFARLKKKY